jgi:hypothetical protein
MKPDEADKGGCYVAMVVDRKEPDVAEMTPSDFENAEREVWRARQMNSRMGFQGRKNPLAWFNLQQQFSIQEVKKGEKPVS